MAAEETSDQMLKKVFLVTMVSAVLFCGAVFIFVLPYPNP
jgi:hypothetical protein